MYARWANEWEESGNDNGPDRPRNIVPGATGQTRLQDRFIGECSGYGHTFARKSSPREEMIYDRAQRYSSARYRGGSKRWCTVARESVPTVVETFYFISTSFSFFLTVPLFNETIAIWNKLKKKTRASVKIIGDYPRRNEISCIFYLHL